MASAQADPEKRLEESRMALKGTHKDLAKAKALLLEITQEDKQPLTSLPLCYAYVYLGYIADKEGKRQEALFWYQKAIEIKEADGIAACAKAGLERPLTWIRHLDEGTAPPTIPFKRIEQIARGYVASGEPPKDLRPAEALTEEERQENFDVLCEAIDKYYAHFQIKSLNWQEVRDRYRSLLASITTTPDFYLLLFHLVNELKDTHSSLHNYKPSSPAVGPGLMLDIFEDAPFVVAIAPESNAGAAGVELGSKIVEVDGMAVASKLEQLSRCLRACSSQRAFRRQAYRHLLAGEPGTIVNVKLLSPRGVSKEVILKRNAPIYLPQARKYPFDVAKQRFVHYGRHPSRLGYIHIESFNGREEIADEFDTALESLRETPGLILDIRDNQGGFGTAQPRIVGRFITTAVLVATSYTRNGPGHGDFQKREDYFEPSGKWQYLSPVALLVNDVTGSAADLFACYMRNSGRVVTIGSTTHGNLSGVAVYAVLPCNLIVRISNGYICDAKGIPIELNGNEPDLVARPSVFDFLSGRDPVLDRAVAALRRETK